MDRTGRRRPCRARPGSGRGGRRAGPARADGEDPTGAVRPAHDRTGYLSRGAPAGSAGGAGGRAGERLQIDGYAEISAVCVDPGFRGQGLATGLMARLMALIRARGEVPILHVLASNHNAISLYRTLGFVVRREVHLTVLDCAAD
ncbi:GNAT family N-acetyltransferase [Burkholderia plantarii]|uniref:GNAT family N-acetyltransferase n=1 Tax=Burkholderia plantarii TaxID=41899 RepID=UPI003398DFF7